MSEIHQKTPEVPFIEISKMVAQEWKNLSEDKKKKYTKKEEEAKKQYVISLAEYNNNKQNKQGAVAVVAGKNTENASAPAAVPKTKAEKKAEK